ncbi:MAG: hypothetical protein JXA25_17585 [Anaerolineales bacterium]|nr:hypothetical protein [Anaerolineales bacterium]
MEIKRAFLLVSLFAAAAAVFAGGCGQVSVAEPVEEVFSIPDLNRFGEEKYLDRIVTVEGVFVADPIPILVTDLDYVLVNSPVPDLEYILIKGDIAEDIDPEKYGGATLEVRGSVKSATEDDEDDRAEGLPPIFLEVHEYTALKVLAEPYFPTTAAPVWFDADNIAPVSANRYAILFSGGYDPYFNYARYWNDLKFMYYTLVYSLGFPEENITVLYANGDPEDFDMPVENAAILSNLEDAFEELRETTTRHDILFFFSTNHGGGFWITDCGTLVRSGQVDLDNDEPNEFIKEIDYNLDLNDDGDMLDTVSWDESLYAWERGDIYDDIFHTIVADLEFHTMVIVMEQCFGGGLIWDMAQGGDRIIISASGEYETSRASDSNSNYNEFAYHFTSALNHAEPDGTEVYTDYNGNGKVSIAEIFNYASARDSRPETPHYEDSGDGIPVTGPLPSGDDGDLGLLFSLDPP